MSVQKKANPLKDPALPARFAQLIVRRMVKLRLSDEQLLSRLKDLGGISTKGSLSSIRRHKDGTGGQPSAQTIGFYQQALGIADSEIDRLINPHAGQIPGEPGAKEFRDQFQELVEELKRRSNLPYEVLNERAAARVALAEEDLIRARKHLEAAAGMTRKSAEYANEEYARSLAALGALAFTEREFEDARTWYSQAICLPGLSEDRLDRYKSFYGAAANGVLVGARTREESQKILAEMAAVGVKPNVYIYTTLIHLAPTFEEASRLRAEMEAEGIEPNVITYNALIDRAGTPEEMRGVVEEMNAKGVQPTVSTFNTLIDRADSEERAHRFLREMFVAGLAADVITYNILMDRAETAVEARHWLDEMVAANLAPNEISLTTLVKKLATIKEGCELAMEASTKKWFTGRGFYQALFSLGVTHLSVDDLINLYESLPFKYETALESPIRQYWASGNRDAAMRVCLFVPHLPAACKIYRENYPYCKSWLASNKAVFSEAEGNYHYIFGIAAYESGDWPLAVPNLIKARSLAYAAARINHIDRMLYANPSGNGEGIQISDEGSDVPSKGQGI